MTPLQVATRAGFIDLACLLIEKGAKFEVSTGDLSKASKECKFLLNKLGSF